MTDIQDINFNQSINQTLKIKKMKSKNQSDVLEMEVEEMLPETHLEKEIETALVKANVTDQVILKLEETFGGMKLKSLDDKEGYIDIKDARREVRKVGILTEKITKKGREDAVRVQRLWLDKEKEILGKIAKVQDPLDAEIKKFEDELERKEQEEQRKKDEQNIKRQAQLSKYGAVYSNGNFELKHISYESELIKNSDEEMWNEVILPKYKKVYDEIESERVAEETKRKEESDRLKAEQEKFAEEQRKFKEQQDLFRQQQEQLQRQKDEQERKENEIKLQKQREIDAANEKKWRDRLGKLNDIGWDGYFAFAKWNRERIFTLDELINLPDDIFNQRGAAYINSLALRNKDLEEKRLAKIEEDKKAAIQKALDDKKESDRLAELKRQQDLDASNDRAKYDDVVNYLLKTPIHEMKSSIYKSKMNAIKDFINDLKS